MKTSVKRGRLNHPIWTGTKKNKGFGERDLSQGLLFSSRQVTSSNYVGSLSETLDSEKRELRDEIAVCLKGKVLNKLRGLLMLTGQNRACSEELTPLDKIVISVNNDA